MLKVNNIGISYSKLLFADLSFKLGNNEKVGLVGLNGTGKTTLLRILVGDEQPDTGTLEIVNEKIAYLPQEYTFPKGQLVGEILESLVDDIHTEMYKVKRILHLLGLTDIDFYQEVNSLSEGQKMKIYLCTLLVKEPTVLLLDEPTNHLDIQGIKWMESFINKFDGICIIISHDRSFLDNVVNKIFEIEENKLKIFEGNYTNYLVKKEEEILSRRTQYILQERHREKLEELILRARKIKDGKRRGKALDAAAHRLEREVLRNEIDEYKREKIGKITIEGVVHKSKQIIKIKDLTFGYDGKYLITKTNLNLFGDEKVWFLGPNGIGKSTLLKLIIGELKPIQGEVKIGDNLKWAYFSQDQSHLNMDDTVEAYFLRGTGLTYNQSFGVMDKFLFTKDMRNMKIGKLSPGQRARLSFAIFTMKEYDFMILDEPTNHIDIQSKEVIETALREYKGALLLVSHDRYFVQSVGVGRGITIQNGKLVELIDLEDHF